MKFLVFLALFAGATQAQAFVFQCNGFKLLLGSDVVQATFTEPGQVSRGALTEITKYTYKYNLNSWYAAGTKTGLVQLLVPRDILEQELSTVSVGTTTAGRLYGSEHSCTRIE